jgi:AraC-like DNA-binding protein
MASPFLDRKRNLRITLSKDTDRVMILSTDRILYCGLLGERSVMTLGSYTLFVSLEHPFVIRVADGAWQERSVALLPPYVPHQVKSPDRLIATLHIEPESVDATAVPWLNEMSVEGPLAPIADQVRSLYRKLIGADSGDLRWPFDMDEALFGAPLPRRRMDARIESVVDRIKASPCEQFPAEECASELGLSFSRFLHLFRDETGITFRRFRAWKRARSLLQYVNLDANLTDVALEVGYPDASHFSHSIRQIYGLKPKDIFAGSRRLAVLS